LIESIDHITRSTFREIGDTILLLGESGEELGGSEYLAAIHGVVAGAPPECDLELERRAIDAVVEAIRSGVVTSAHDVSDGGLAVAIAECCIAMKGEETGANVDLGDSSTTSFRGALFGESQARFVVTSNDPAAVERIARKHGIPAARLGTVTPADEGFVLHAYGRTIETDIEKLSSAWHDAIPNIMAAPVAVAEPALVGV
jgi:phosphoribosylformylglycinamidine synthase